MKKSEAVFGLVRIPLDALAVACAMLVSYRLRLSSIDLIPGVQLLDPATTLPPIDFYLNSFILPGMLSFVLVAAALKLYALRSTQSGWNEMGNVMLAIVVWFALVMARYFLVERQLFYSRILLLHTVLLMGLLLILVRSFVIIIQRLLLARGIGAHSVLTVGKHPLASSAERVLVDDMRYRYLGHIEGLQQLSRKQGRDLPDLVIQTDANPESEETALLIDHCRSHHIGYAFLPPVFADVPHQLAVERLGLLPMLRFQPTPLDGWGRIGKRLFDFVASAALLLLLSPVLLLIALLVLLGSGWPIFYVSRRIGEHGRQTLCVLKFRTMVRNADRMKDELRTQNHRTDGPLFKMRNDPRITHVGRLLRRFSLDELPQLFNVLIGTMSLVGPRPHLPDEVQKYTSFQRRVFAVKPGMTGLAQVSGRSDLTFANEVALDLQYVEEWSLLLDLWVLWRTLVVVVGRQGAD